MNNRTIKFAAAAVLIGSSVLFSGIEAKAAEVRITLPGISLCFGSDDRPCPPKPHCKPVVVVKPAPPPKPHCKPVVVVKPTPPPKPHCKPVVVVPPRRDFEVKLDFRDHHKDHKRFDRPHRKDHDRDRDRDRGHGPHHGHKR